MPVAFVRCQKVRNIAGLVAAEAHARRIDNSRHVDRERTAGNLAAGYAGVDDPLAILAAFKARKRDAGASERKGASIALHMILGVSPDWVAATGDVHDPANPRNRALFDSARQFMENKFGQGSVIHTRLDVDEAGAGVVDVIVVPVTEYQQRGKTRRQVSANAGLEAAFGRGRNYRRLQSQWAEHCQQTLDSGIERGRSREETGRDFVHHSIYRPAVQEAERKALEIERQAVEAWAGADEWPWRDRDRIVQAARDEGRRQGGEVVRKKAIAALRDYKEKAEKEKIAALELKDKEHAVVVERLEAAADAARGQRDDAITERDDLVVEMGAVKEENASLKNEVSKLQQVVMGLRKVVETIREKAPEPVRRAIDVLMLRDRSGARSDPPNPSLATDRRKAPAP